MIPFEMAHNPKSLRAIFDSEVRKLNETLAHSSQLEYRLNLLIAGLDWMSRLPSTAALVQEKWPKPTPQAIRALNQDLDTRRIPVEKWSMARYSALLDPAL